MKDREGKPVSTDTIFRLMREMLIEASPAEVDALAQEVGMDLRELARTGRNTVSSAIQRIETSAQSDENIVQLHKGLNSLLVLLRRRDNLDEAELAQRANVDEHEIRRIEYDAAYLPSPRTIYNLEKTFQLPSGVLAKLSGAIKHQSPDLEKKVMQFAANAKSMGRLTKSERELLAAFVKFLTEQG
jgi:transcriptional regulator with XRE-family HTH domain